MPDAPKMPRDCLPVPAIHPADGKRWDVYVRQGKITATAKKGMGVARELAYLVPWTLLNPTAIFRGLREEGESQWLCYVSLPKDAYNWKTGDRLAGGSVPRLRE